MTTRKCAPGAPPGAPKYAPTAGEVVRPSPYGGAPTEQCAPSGAPRAPSTINVDRCVCWCPSCVTWVNDQPTWAEQHHAETGHPTHRRSWRVETWSTP